MMLSIPLWAGLAAMAGKSPCTDEAQIAGNSATILSLYEAGEADRESRSAIATSVLDRDEKRAKQVVKLDRKGQLCTVADKWHAAWLMQQSDDVEVLERAYELAVETMEARDPRGPWLVAFTFDNKRTVRGYPQSYGTRNRVDEMGRRCLIELDDTTDEQRALYGIEPLSATYRRILDLNGYTDDAPTEQRMRRHSLICPPLAQEKRDQRRVGPPPE